MRVAINSNYLEIGKDNRIVAFPSALYGAQKTFGYTLELHFWMGGFSKIFSVISARHSEIFYHPEKILLKFEML